MNVLGISAFYHDSAAALVRDGVIVAAAQEERFTRKKHDAGFPGHAVDYCLAEAGITAAELDAVAFNEKPLLKFDRLLETYLGFAPRGFRSFRQAMPRWLRHKLNLGRDLHRRLPGYRHRFVFPEHHESHAASAFFPSPFRDAAIMTLDGVGEWATATLGVGHGNRIELTRELRWPHSLGMLYSAFTYFTGFKVNSGEYKLMGLAPYGEPRYRDLILERLVDLRDDGSFRLDLDYFAYCEGLTMTGPRMDELLGGPPRRPEAPITRREMDLAASIQAVTEEIMLRSARFLAAETGLRRLVLAGGVALNCVGNGKLLRDGCFDDLWIQPAAGDAGGALGAALLTWHQLLDNPREADDVHDFQQASLLGPRFDDDQVRAALDQAGARYQHIDGEDRLLDAVVDALEAGKIVGFFSGRMEFGPRALGSRSILGDARSPQMQSEMNLKTKFRESFRPFAPVVLRDHVHEWFEMRPGQDSPYMLLVAPVHPDRRRPPPADGDQRSGFDRLGVVRSQVPAITHVDYSARVQTVDSRHGRLHRVLERFHQRTGCPVLVNTSFNIRGEPIVCTPADAYRCFLACKIDVLVVESFLLHRSDQPPLSEEQIAAYKAGFELD